MNTITPCTRRIIALTLLVALGASAPARADILYVSNTGGDAIWKIPSSGVASHFADTGFMAGPEGLAFDSAGNLYAANFHDIANNIVKFTPAGTSSVFASHSTGANQPIGLAFDSAGNLFAGNATDHTIEKFNTAGVGSLYANIDPNAATGLAFDSAGNLYVATEANNIILKFTPGGVRSNFATINTLPNSLAALAIDGANNLYVSDANANKIDKINLTTGVLSVFAHTGLNQPIGLAFDSAGNLYAANQGNNTIEKFTPGGVGSLFSSPVGLGAPQYLAFTNDAGVPLLLPNQISAVPLPSAATMGLPLLASLVGVGLLQRRALRSI